MFQQRGAERYNGEIKSSEGEKLLLLQAQQLLHLKEAPNLWFKDSSIIQKRKMRLLIGALLKLTNKSSFGKSYCRAIQFS